MSNTVEELTDANFETVALKSDRAVLVDFWAPWCGPCRGMAPILTNLAAERSDSLRVVKVNVDENQEWARTYQVRGIPALFLFKNGEIVSKRVGAMTKMQLDEFVNPHINDA